MIFCEERLADTRGTKELEGKKRREKKGVLRKAGGLAALRLGKKPLR